MRVLVTGADGFIGSHLMDRLDNAVGIDKKTGMSTVDYLEFNKKVMAYKPDVIVHLGASASSQISLRDPKLDFVDNVVGTFNVCEVASRLKIPVIFNSSMKIYPGTDGLVSPYGLSKQIGELYLTHFAKLYGLEYVINRPSSVYGARQEGSEDGGWFTWFVIAASQGKKITLFGDGKQTRDVLYVSDCVDLLVDQINNFDLYKGSAYDFGGGLANVVSLNELLNALDYHNVKYAGRLKGDVEHFVCNNIKVRAVNGWRPKVSWVDGLERTKQWLAQS